MSNEESQMFPYISITAAAMSTILDGARLPANHRQRIDPAGRLAVESLQPEVDAGRYECQAEEAGVSARGTVAVQVVVAPELDPNTFPEKVVARAGTRVKLLCSVIGGDGPLNVGWVRTNRGPLGPDVTLQPLEDSAVLILFRRLAPHMAGNYTCFAENRAALVERHTTLEVQGAYVSRNNLVPKKSSIRRQIHGELGTKVPPRWTVEPRDISVVAGQPVLMDCVAEGLPNPSVLWRKKQEGYTVQLFLRDFVVVKTVTLCMSGSHYSAVTPGYRRQMLENGTLSLVAAEPGDAGHYMCQAANGVGAGLSKVVSLTVHRPPSFPAKFSTVSVPRDHTAQLSCAASGDQPLEISWEKDKQPLSSNPRYSVTRTDDGATSLLTITGSGRQDSALFTCMATNTYGNDETNIQLVVQEAPGPPSDVTLQSKTGRSVTVSWTSPYTGNSPIVRYHIFVSNVTAPAITSTCPLCEKELSQSIDGGVFPAVGATNDDILPFLFSRLPKFEQRKRSSSVFHHLLQQELQRETLKAYFPEEHIVPEN
ncbi:hypothetical protein LAZ67_1005432 [Cordylochernes scorpioides]|uniref:Ig-like domain-containing protein n=1 Tax=Cordylochernes scorpioides TaxID=51811 RepID=A0ABY6K307_9ARAC|nr:hypothetical protein LAZ67_1005432 [Cordylochernes scorpioides]